MPNINRSECLRVAATIAESVITSPQEDSWCNGAAGVLIARLAQLESGAAASAARDVERAAQGVCAEVGKMNPAESWFTLRSGLGGIALSRAGARSGPTAFRDRRTGWREKCGRGRTADGPGNAGARCVCDRVNSATKPVDLASET